MAEKDKQYRYSGPLSGVTLADREVPLVDGATVSLPPDNPYVKRLVAMKRLTETAPPKGAAKSKEDPANAS